jgi:CO/xanthine dehydrogenase FAD-binding subunit
LREGIYTKHGRELKELLVVKGERQMLDLHRIAEIKNKVGAAVRHYQIRSDSIKNYYHIVNEARTEAKPDLVDAASAGGSDLARWFSELEQIKEELAERLGEDTEQET